MEEIGAGGIERLATQNTIGGLLMHAMGKESEPPLHLIPFASLTVNLRVCLDRTYFAETENFLLKSL